MYPHDSFYRAASASNICTVLSVRMPITGNAHFQGTLGRKIVSGKAAVQRPNLLSTYWLFAWLQCLELSSNAMRHDASFTQRCTVPILGHIKYPKPWWTCRRGHLPLDPAMLERRRQSTAAIVQRQLQNVQVSESVAGQKVTFMYNLTMYSLHHINGPMLSYSHDKVCTPRSQVLQMFCTA